MKETPLRLEGINDNIYAGFGLRLGSILLDLLILIPIGIATLYINSINMNYFYYTAIPNLAFGLYYNVFLPRYTGGTPGKNIVGIKIIKLDGTAIGWKEAFLRYCVLFGISVFSIIIMAVSLHSADSEKFNSLGWLQQTAYLITLSPILYSVMNWLNNLWIWGELIVLLTNPRKRAVHDYIAGTVIVKAIYVDRIREVMEGVEDVGVLDGGNAA